MHIYNNKYHIDFLETSKRITHEIPPYFKMFNVKQCLMIISIPRNKVPKLIYENVHYT